MQVVVDTLFLCYCEDLRIHEYCDEVEPGSGYDTVDHPSAAITVHRSADKTYFAKPSLREVMLTPMDKSDIQMTGLENLLQSWRKFVNLFLPFTAKTLNLFFSVPSTFVLLSAFV